MSDKGSNSLKKKLFTFWVTLLTLMSAFCAFLVTCEGVSRVVPSAPGRLPDGKYILWSFWISLIVASLVGTFVAKAIVKSRNKKK